MKTWKDLYNEVNERHDKILEAIEKVQESIKPFEDGEWSAWSEGASSVLRRFRTALEDSRFSDSRTQRRKTMIQAMAAEVRAVNMTNGWFEKDRTIGEGMALLMSEGAEAFDAWRKYGFEDTIDLDKCKHDPSDPHIDSCKPIGYGSELADVLIRLLDQCDRDDVDLIEEFHRKLAYNRTRGYQHGGRRV